MLKVKSLHHRFLCVLRIAIVIAFYLHGVNSVRAQYPRNYSLSNYNGVLGAAFNPAHLADNRQRFSITPFSAFIEAENNFVNVKTPYSQVKALRGKLPEYQLDENGYPIFHNSYLEDKLNTNRKQAYAAVDIAGPSFMLGLNNKSGIGFSMHTKAFVNVKNLNEDLLKIFLDDFDTTYAGWTPSEHQKQYIGLPNSQERFGAGVLAYQEFAFSYASVLMDEKQHFLKGGVTYKYLIGLAATYITVDNLSYELQNVDTIRWNAADMNMAYVSEDYYTTHTRMNDYLGKNKLGKGSAIDIGVVYEFRPKYKEYYYRMDKRRVEDRTANKYLLKVGASISDFGRINFNNTAYTRQRNILGDSAVDWSHFKRVQKFNGSDDIDSFLFTLFPKSDSTNTFNAKLPASFNLMADFNLAPNWYVGGSFITTLRGNKVNGVRKPNTWSFGARYETRKLEFGANLILGKFYNPIHLGMHMRLGPLFIGSDNLGGVFTSNSTNGINIFAGIQLPILHNKIPDMDGDMVSDGKDECPNEFGSESAKGCPDTDGDKVADAEDLCPDVPGERKTKGCPDPDGDQLVGIDDKCPDKQGTPEFEGCPDTDGDGLPDHKDRCPDESGLKDNNGCPESEDEEEIIEVETIAEVKKADPPKEVGKPITEVKRPANVSPSTKNVADPKTPKDVVDLMDYEIYDYYLILGVYENKHLADMLVRKLNNEAGVLTYIYYDESNKLNYVTFGRATGTDVALSQLKMLDQPKVNARINGHVWWKKVPK